MLKKKGIVEPFGGTALASALTAVGEAIEAFEADNESILSDTGREAFVELRTTLKYLSAQLQERMERAWQGYATTIIPQLSKDILDVLGNIKSFRPAVRDISSQLSSLKARAQKLPTTSQELNAFAADAKKLTASWKKLGSEELPQGVLRFLRAASSRAGADVASLTEEVRDWLEERGLIESFRIKLLD